MSLAVSAPEGLRLALLNPWQHDFPLQREPFAVIADALSLPTERVLSGYRELLDDGSLSRIGGVFAAGAGGAGTLAAMAVPPERLEAVAAIVSAHPGVNHNYEREHRFNLWFVMTGRDRAAVDAAIDALEAATGLTALRLRMLRPYRIDLGFDLSADLNGGAGQPHCAARRRSPAARAGLPAPAVDPADWPLAAQVEAGLPLEARPFDRWAERLGRRPEAVLDTLAGWLRGGTLSRFGTVVRHHELGWSANAMTVFDVPDDRVDACGAALARIPGVTLAYRRERAALWRYNLYCMVHGRSREAVQQVLGEAIGPCGLADCPRAVLFSRRRFKQTGARRFRDRMGAAGTSAHPAMEAQHASA
jgi:DNA-binding Lrp family transcriptional regulator